MKYRRVGKSGLRVSEIALGAWLTYGGPVEQERTNGIVAAAIDSGVNFIDIADAYAKGNAEEMVGKAIKPYRRSDLVISSKLFWPMSKNANDRGLSRKHIMESIDKSLQRIGTDYLDIYYCHRFDPHTEVEETVRAMEDLIRQGKILYWGTSVWSPAQIERAIGLADKFNAYRPIVEQPRYNAVDRGIEADVIPTCKYYGLGLTVWSPLAQGLLTGKYRDGAPEGSRGATTDWMKGDLTPDNIERANRMEAIAKDLGVTLSQLSLAWVLRLEAISCAITGATKVDHVLDNAKGSDLELTAETLGAIEKALALKD